MKLKSFFAALLLLCVGSTSLYAENRAEELLAQMSAGFRAMKSYKVTFAVTSGDYTSEGHYAVAGDRYYLKLGEAEVFCDGKTRREIDNRRREITISEVDSASHSLLDNPAHAFEFLDDEYSAALSWEKNGKAAIVLTPTVKNSTVGNTITLTLTTDSAQPVGVVYSYDGEDVYITLREIAHTGIVVPNFDRKAFSNYEQIDFR